MTEDTVKPKRVRKKEIKTNWLSQTLMHSHVSYVLCTSEEHMMRVYKDLGVVADKRTMDFPANGENAFVQILDNDVHGGVVAVVCIKDVDYRDRIQTFGMLSHEAVHIFQEICNLIGESEPSKEFEAYSIEAITVNLAREYERQTVKE